MSSNKIESRKGYRHPHGDHKRRARGVNWWLRQDYENVEVRMGETENAWAKICPSCAFGYLNEEGICDTCEVYLYE